MPSTWHLVHLRCLRCGMAGAARLRLDLRELMQLRTCQCGGRLSRLAVREVTSANDEAIPELLREEC